MVMPEAAQKQCMLLVDDDPLIVESLSIVLQEDYELITASTRQQANSQLQKRQQMPSIALVDLGLPPQPHSPEEGFTLIKDLLGFNRRIKTLILSGQSDQSNIQHALTLGAVDFIPKPCDVDLLQARLQHQVMILNAERSAKVEGQDQQILGESSEIVTLRSLIQQFAEQPFPVLIEGESGCGKELVAEQLHQLSSRQSSPFLIINCAAFSGELLESQLFGHSKGAFTGASSQKTGFFEEASEGCLFLDEIAEMPVELQAKLLRVLESGEFYRVGETQARKSNARIIAATNRYLREEVREGRFRQDLFHRLSVLSIHVPPLRQRGSDCLLLLNNFRDLYCPKGSEFELSGEAELHLSNYFFPGNVRELRNIVIRLGAKYAKQLVGLTELKQELETVVDQDLNSEMPGSSVNEVLEQELANEDFNLDRTLSQWELRYIKLALRLTGGNLSKAARMLGVNRTTLYSRIQRLSIE